VLNFTLPFAFLFRASVYRLCLFILFIETTRHEVRPPGQSRTVCILGGDCCFGSVARFSAFFFLMFARWASCFSVITRLGLVGLVVVAGDCVCCSMIPVIPMCRFSNSLTWSSRERAVRLERSQSATSGGPWCRRAMRACCRPSACARMTRSCSSACLTATATLAACCWASWLPIASPPPRRRRHHRRRRRRQDYCPRRHRGPAAYLTRSIKSIASLPVPPARPLQPPSSSILLTPQCLPHHVCDTRPQLSVSSLAWVGEGRTGFKHVVCRRSRRHGCHFEP
jgi:hypothetical protein